MMLDTLRGELRHAARGLVRSRGFSILAVSTLALGIGATTTMFSVVHAMLLRQLPYPEADRLVSVSSIALDAGNFAEWRTGLASLEELGGVSPRRAVLTGGTAAQVVQLHAVTEAYLPLLGARASAGRLWGGADHDAAAAPTALVTDALWRTLAEGAPFAPGRSVTVGTVTYEVIGVLVPSFRELRYGPADVFVPLAQERARAVAAIGRLRRGMTAEAAELEAVAFAERLGAREQADRIGLRTLARVTPFHELITMFFRDQLLVLFAAAALVLLIACANVANLLLSRASSRVHELSVRAALGAGRGALLRALLYESALLAFAGGALGVLLARASIRVLPAVVPAQLPRLGDVGVNGVVLAFALAATALATVAAGLAPAFAAARAASRVANTGPQRSTQGLSARRWREALIVAEVALALMLSIGTILLVRTFLTLRPSDPGFAIDDRIVARLELPQSEDARRIEMIRQLTERVEAALPGTRVAVVTSVPLSGESMTWQATDIDGRAVETADNRPLTVHFRAATPGYTEIIGLPLVRGRPLVENDAAGAPPVLVVNESAARRLWPDLADPLGRTVTLELANGLVTFTVVGVLADARIFGGMTESRPEVFASFWQSPWEFGRLVVHAPPGSPFNGEALRAAATATDPLLAVSDVRTMASIAAQSNAGPRFEMTVMSSFGVLALVLALVGCYGVLAYFVTRQTREIGIRMALGATRRSVIGRIVAHGAVLTGLGIAIGTAGALAATRVLTSRLYGVSATDPITFVAAAAGLLLAGLLAATLPARRAATVEPLQALKEAGH